MKNIFLKLVASATLLAASASSFATPMIEGQIAFSGLALAEYNQQKTKLENVSFNSVSVLATTGDFSSVAPGSVAQFNDIKISDSNVQATGGAEFWSVGDFTFTLTNIVYNKAEKNGVLNDFIANGILKANGYSDTAGMMKFSSNQFGLPNQFIFAASAVPAPATVALLGLALVGFGVARRKKQA